MSDDSNNIDVIDDKNKTRELVDEDKDNDADDESDNLSDLEQEIDDALKAENNSDKEDGDGGDNNNNVNNDNEAKDDEEKNGEEGDGAASSSSGSDYTTDSEEAREREKERAREKRKKKKAVITGANFLNKLRGKKKESSSSSSSSSEQEEIEYYSDEVENMLDLVKALKVNILNESDDESWDPAMGKRIIIKECCGSLRIHTTQIREDIINEQQGLDGALEEAKLKLYEYENDVYLKHYYHSIEQLKEKLVKIQERMDYEKHRMEVYSQGDVGATEIGKQLLENKYLKRLRLIDAQIGPKGCKAMAPAIKRHRRLEHLGLKFNYIQPAGVKYILKASRNNRRGGLRELDLYGCKLGPEGAKVIAEELKQNTFLEVLRLRFNGIGPEGATSLGEMLPHNEALLTLDLSNNGMEWEGVTKIGAGLKKNTIIQTVDVTNNNIIEKLRKNAESIIHRNPEKLLEEELKKNPGMTEEEKEEFLNKKKEKDGCIADARLLYSDKLDGVWTHFMEFFKPHIV